MLAPVKPTLADWIDLLVQLQRDEGLPDAELRRRDRALGARLAAGAPARRRPLARLLAWLRAVAPVDSPGRRVAEAVRLAAVLLAAGGFLLGASAALGAFSFQPRGRINVVAVLIALVGTPSLFLALALLNALPRRLRRWLPWIGSEPEGGGLLQPARWALRALPGSVRSSLETAWGESRSARRLSAPVRRWLLLSASQGAAVAFSLGALATALALVVFSDLSFGWSTTLEIDASRVQRATDILSAPWSHRIPAAVPTAELIARTRFFRIAAEPGPDTSPELFGGWWPFVVMTIAVYGLAPRLLFLVFARLQLQRALVRACVEAPGARRLLDRLDSPLVETSLDEAASAAGARGSGPVVESRSLPARAVLVRWAEADASRVPGEVVARFEAGGLRAPADDERTVAAAADAAQRHDVAIVVSVRGFEPPLLELVDFLRELRRALGDGREIAVIPSGGDDVAHLAWRRKLSAVGDPWLRWAAS